MSAIEVIVLAVAIVVGFELLLRLRLRFQAYLDRKRAELARLASPVTRRPHRAFRFELTINGVVIPLGAASIQRRRLIITAAVWEGEQLLSEKLGAIFEAHFEAHRKRQSATEWVRVPCMRGQFAALCADGLPGRIFSFDVTGINSVELGDFVSDADAALTQTVTLGIKPIGATANEPVNWEGFSFAPLDDAAEAEDVTPANNLRPPEADPKAKAAPFECEGAATCEA